MKTNKNIITMSCLLTLLGNGAQVFAANGDEGNSPNTTIKHDTTRLPAKFREKFRLGEYVIDESDGNIRIDRCDINGGEFQSLAQAIQDGKVLDFWTKYASKDSDRTIIYLQVGDGVHYYPELFERLIIVRDKESSIDLQHGYRNPMGSFGKSRGLTKYIKDDRNIVQELSRNEDLSRAFQSGNAAIYVYHKACNVITSLHFERSEPEVSKIDSQRISLQRAKSLAINLGKWALIYKGGMLLKGALSGLPIIGMTGPVIGAVATYAGFTFLYQTYKLICPASAKAKVNRFLEGKVDPRIPMFHFIRKTFLSLQQ
jgi:hypothetical protein